MTTRHIVKPGHTGFGHGRRIGHRGRALCAAHGNAFQLAGLDMLVFRKAPLTEAEAGRMLDELKSRVILSGVRGKAPVDRVALARMVSAVSCFGAAAGTRLRQLAFNPVLAGRTGQLQ